MGNLAVRSEKTFRALRFELHGYVKSHPFTQYPKQRYSIVNRGELAKLLGINDDAQMMEVHRQWVEALLKTGSNKRNAQWTESIFL